LSDTLYMDHLFFQSDFIERIVHPAQTIGFEDGAERNMGHCLGRDVDYCMHQGHKICIFSLNAS
jgi:hypothetical protein